MKINKKITAATEDMPTVFYKVEEDQMINAFKNSRDTNVFLIYMIESHGFECLDLSKMFGSGIADDGNLYICKTDGQLINVNGKEVDPEDALKDCTIEELPAYIQDADDETILWYITPDEIIVDKDIDDVAKEMLEEGYHFDELVADCREIWPDNFY